MRISIRPVGQGPALLAGIDGVLAGLIAIRRRFSLVDANEATTVH